MFQIAWTVFLFRSFEKELTTMQNFEQMGKTGIFRSQLHGNPLKPNIDIVTDGSVECLLSVNAKTFSSFKENVVQKVH